MDAEELAHASLFTELRVVTSAAWLARDLASARVLPVVHDLGLDLPADHSRTAWWCPGQYAARLEVSGVPVAFVAPTAPWQASFPTDLTGRTIEATTLGRLRTRDDQLGGVFAKLADVKLAAVPAQWWDSRALFVQACDASRVPDSTPVLLTSTRLDIVEEHRCFITAGKVTAASIYLAGDVTWDAWETGTQPSSHAAAAFAQTVADRVSSQPPGWVLDVALTTAGDWLALEGNPSWSANPYHCDPLGVVRSILAAHDPRGHARQWTWDGGEVLRSRARPLPVRRPVR